MQENTQISKEIDSSKVILRTHNISKAFPGVQALRDVNFEVRPGEIIGFVGENGAGKSTLIKILSGVHTEYEGSLEMDGKPIRFNLPSDAKKAGIGVIHQELNYVGSISVAENIFMQDIPKKRGIIDYPKMRAETKRILETVSLDIDPNRNIETCTVAEKQLIEIAKVIDQDARIIIMDEPTAALADAEVERLFVLMKRASEMGIAIIYISHRLDEVLTMAHRVVVLRDGQVVGGMDIKDATKQAIINLMVGRDVSNMYPKTPHVSTEMALEVEGITTDVLKDVSFQIKHGEILGIYGLMGSGHEQIGPALFGQINTKSGNFSIKGKKARIKDPLDAIQQGIAYVPTERKTEGVILNTSVKNNILLAYYSLNKKKKWISQKNEKSIAAKWIQAMRIKASSDEMLVGNLSGGNQQKVVLSKWLELESDIIILSEPTRGIDIGAKVEIYDILGDLCKKGKAIIMITSEMMELLSMSDTILVLHNGRVTGTLDGKTATSVDVMRYAIGGNE